MIEELARAGITVFERGWLSSNNVLLRSETPGSSVLVDSGYWSHAEQTTALVRSALGGEALGRIVNTHLHSDHCGGNARLQAEHGCAIDVPIGEARCVDDWDEERLSYRGTGQGCPRFRRTGQIALGDRMALGRWTWEAIGAPGHDPHSIALYQPELQVLISADALWEEGFGVVFPELEGEDAFEAVGLTLDAFARLSVRWVIPGHGAPFSELGPALDRARRRLAQFIADPVRHARYAGKVLIKFHLLEVQSAAWPALTTWIEETPYFRLIHSRHFLSTPFDAWYAELIDELVRAGALARDRQGVRNA
ncbi:MAG TPA: MBL fold metallo-hydrolase [Hyphomicrobiaceae bacterium]|nr:MBL fold metallo-hydrolase [Hyphomicrobiaceae bacterium]